MLPDLLALCLRKVSIRICNYLCCSQLIWKMFNENLDKLFMRKTWWCVNQTVQNWHNIDYHCTSTELVQVFLSLKLVFSIIISFNLLSLLFCQVPPAFAIFSGIGCNGNASAFSKLRTFPVWNENDVKVPKMYQLT